jgi:uncharacterized membrane protein
LLAVVAIAIAPKPAAKPIAADGAAPAVVDAAKVMPVIQQRCATCHADKPTQQGFATAPAGIMLHTPDLLRQHAAKVYQQSVQLKSMPIGNLTNMTDDERALIAQWYESGAK